MPPLCQEKEDQTLDGCIEEQPPVVLRPLPGMDMMSSNSSEEDFILGNGVDFVNGGPEQLHQENQGLRNEIALLERQLEEVRTKHNQAKVYEELQDTQIQLASLREYIQKQRGIIDSLKCGIVHIGGTKGRHFLRDSIAAMEALLFDGKLPQYDDIDPDEDKKCASSDDGASADAQELNDLQRKSIFMTANDDEFDIVSLEEEEARLAHGSSNSSTGSHTSSSEATEDTPIAYSDKNDLSHLSEDAFSRQIQKLQGQQDRWYFPIKNILKPISPPTSPDHRASGRSSPPLKEFKEQELPVNTFSQELILQHAMSANQHASTAKKGLSEMLGF